MEDINKGFREWGLGCFKGYGCDSEGAWLDFMH
jgi:hypothetical protein